MRNFTNARIFDIQRDHGVSSLTGFEWGNISCYPRKCLRVNSWIESMNDVREKVKLARCLKNILLQQKNWKKFNFVLYLAKFSHSVNLMEWNEYCCLEKQCCFRDCWFSARIEKHSIQSRKSSERMKTAARK